MDELVTLEAYAEENRALIHNGRNDQVIANCKHILRYYPKHVESYRQMGEAHLEKDELESAVDLFRRVLSADPENVIAYVGLATAFEKQHLIDEAVWHLERADEIEPGNFEIHKELLRLYSDAGKPRQRIKLSPAGLARLYDQEGLYSQAIQELHGIVDATPARYDARTALAETLWHAGRIRESAEIAQNILTSLPYCLKANLILGTAWRESGLPDHQVYLDRAQELDPSHKMAVRLLGARSPLSVTQVSVPRYVPEATPPVMPQLSPAPATQTTTESIETRAEEPAAPSTDFVAEPPAVEEEAAVVPPLEPETEPTIKPNLPGANLPPWLVSQFPESGETAAPIQAPPASADTVSEPGTAVVESTEDKLPRWLEGESLAPPPSEPTAAEMPETAAEKLPAWLENPTAEAGAPLSSAEQSQVEEPQPAEDVPDWLRGMQTQNPPAVDSELARPEEPTATEEYALPSFLAPEVEGTKATEESTPRDFIVPSGQELETTAEQPAPDMSQPTPIEKHAPVPVDQAVEAQPIETTAKQPAPDMSQPTPIEEYAPVPVDQAVEAQSIETSAGQPALELSSQPTPIEERAPAPVDQVAEAEPIETSAEQPAPDLSQPAPIEEHAPVPVDQAVEPQPVETAAEPPAPDLSQSASIGERYAPVPIEQATETQPAETAERASSSPIVVEMPTALPAPGGSTPQVAAEAAARAPAAAPAPARKRRPKGSEHLALARKHRDTGQTNDALAEYDYCVLHAPRLVNDVIADLEILTAREDAPLDAHRILGDAYTRADRLAEALERYQYVLERTSNG